MSGSIRRRRRRRRQRQRGRRRRTRRGDAHIFRHHRLRYIIQRSADLTAPGSGWAEVYRYDTSNNTFIETGVTADENSGTQTITLTDPSISNASFYRLLVEQVL